MLTDTYAHTHARARARAHTHTHARARAHAQNCLVWLELICCYCRGCGEGVGCSVKIVLQRAVPYELLRIFTGAVAGILMI